MTNVRKDETIPPEKPGIDFLLPDEKESLQKEQGGSSTDSKKKGSSIPTLKPAPSRPLRVAGKSIPQPAASRSAENMFVEDMTSIPEGAHWNCVHKGKIHVLDIFAGSARFSQWCALSGFKVGTPVDIRSGFDVMTSKRRHMVMEIIKRLISVSWCQSVDHGQTCRTSKRANRKFGKSDSATCAWLSSWRPLRDIS